MPRIPDRWEIYSKFGKVIKGTQFLACKTPLKPSLTVSLADDMRFTPNDLMEAMPQIGLVVDFTNTERYYNPNDFTHEEGIDYMKIFTEGHVIPKKASVSLFFDTVDNFLKDPSKKNKIIVAHCTHGINRTGYLICRYMITKLNFPPHIAIDEFGKARGHAIERKNYIADLLKFHPRFDFSLSDSKSKASSQHHLPHSERKRKPNGQRQRQHQQDGDNFSNNAFHSQNVSNHYRQTAPYQQEPNPQWPHHQRPYRYTPYQWNPCQRNNRYQYNSYDYAPHEQQSYKLSEMRGKYGMYGPNKQSGQQGHWDRREHYYGRFQYRDQRRDRDDY